MLATEYAQYYGIASQGEGEADMVFRNRVSGALRDMGHIIEAHEAWQDKLYDQSDDVMTGVIGAVAQVLQGVDYGSRGASQVGDDIAAGAIVQNPQHKMDANMALFAMLLLSR